ncbi:MAG: (4Fe-4S)-binding protein [Pyrinomonadaceae bacterium]|nr:(4Fe-4S)-binding protein [Sphingobacteriaceae bacterium]
METIKKYQKDNLTIIWKPKKCIHSGVCVKTLPKVYDPKATPWINSDNASAEALKSQIDACPSGALSYTEANDDN